MGHQYILIEIFLFYHQEFQQKIEAKDKQVFVNWHNLNYYLMPFEQQEHYHECRFLVRQFDYL